MRIASVFPKESKVSDEVKLLRDVERLGKGSGYVAWSNDESCLLYDEVYGSESDANDAASCSGDYSSVVVGVR